MGSLAFVPGDPHPALRESLGRYVGYAERADAPLARREVAGARCVLIVGWGEPLDIAHPNGPDRAVHAASFTGGASDSYVDTTTTGLAEGVQLTLDPLVAGQVLGLPIGELANRVVTLEDAVPALKDLPERLGDAPDWPSRFAVLDEVLGRRLAEAPAADRAVRQVWSRLQASRGSVTVEDLAADVGWSRRHLSEVTRRELGLPPKVLARLLRFAHASNKRDRAAVHGWAAVAAECGYYDQAHLIRDFRAFAGTTPTALHPFVRATQAPDSAA
jgi:AraC-like DNA-binding protein